MVLSLALLVVTMPLEVAHVSNLHEGMRLVPAGAFTMGRELGPPDQVPAHLVALDAFWLDETLVTVAAFRAFVDATGHRTSAENAGSGKTAFVGMKDWEWREVRGATWRAPWGTSDTSKTSGGSVDVRDDHPVTMVSWNDARAFCAWAGKRLPTEAEWEYAMRAGSTTRFPWGPRAHTDDGRRMLGRDGRDDARARFNHWEGATHAENPALDGFVYLSPVRAYPPNAWGFYDPVGNVWQWTADWYAPDTFALDAATRGETHNPTGPATGTHKVARGGSWWCSASTCHGFGLVTRGKTLPSAPFSNNGFRCARNTDRRPE